MLYFKVFFISLPTNPTHPPTHTKWNINRGWQGTPSLIHLAINDLFLTSQLFIFWWIRLPRTCSQNSQSYPSWIYCIVRRSKVEIPYSHSDGKPGWSQPPKSCYLQGCSSCNSPILLLVDSFPNSWWHILAYLTSRVSSPRSAFTCQGVQGEASGAPLGFEQQWPNSTSATISPDGLLLIFSSIPLLSTLDVPLWIPLYTHHT